jgi:alkylation response protein AidB-like acyl-CoA dehydrogenase
MDIRFTPDEDAFREEVREFIAARLDPATRRAMEDGRVPSKAQVVAWQRALNSRGWATPAWPAEHGGPGWSPVQRLIFLDELHQTPAPEPVSFNVAMLGPVLIRFGTAEQQVRFLPATANLDIWWAQGFSEPGAGSDLASLTTRAARNADDYVVNGHKIWQGMAHHADWMFTLVRTDSAAKKQAGISFMLIDLRSPGITVRPIITIDGRHEVNEVFLDNVVVPAGNLVGAENQGWEVTKFLLSAERTNIARIGMTKHILRRGKRLMQGDAGFARKSAAIEAELKVLEITQLRIMDGQARSGAADPRSSVLKLKGVELRQAASELLLSAMGAAGLREADGDPDGDPDPMTTVAPNYFTLRAASIYGGASEVQKTIIAKTLLEL